MASVALEAEQAELTEAEGGREGTREEGDRRDDIYRGDR